MGLTKQQQIDKLRAKAIADGIPVSLPVKKELVYNSKPGRRRSRRGKFLKQVKHLYG